ncbi:MAG: thioredoxin domain-containing protein [Patescibacteria group bacterium]
MNNRKIKTLFSNLAAVAVVVVILVLVTRLLKNDPVGAVAGVKLSESQLTTFAEYLTEKGVVMYGAYWCSHCQNQKQMFGSAFQYITYVECTKETEKCVAAGVKGYPTWIFPKADKAGVDKLEGEITLDKLAQTAGYQFPPSENETKN